MGYDAAALSRALERPEITIPFTAPKLHWLGRWALKLGMFLRVVARTRHFEACARGETDYEVTYTGRLLSAIEFEAFADRWVLAVEGKLTPEENRVMVEEYLDAIGIPVEVMYTLPPGDLEGAVAHFFRCQVMANLTPEKREIVRTSQSRRGPSSATTSNGNTRTATSPKS